MLAAILSLTVQQNALSKNFSRLKPKKWGQFNDPKSAQKFELDLHFGDEKMTSLSLVQRSKIQNLFFSEFGHQ